MFCHLPSHCFEEGATAQEIRDDAEFWANPIGSGAYYVSETSYPNYIILSAFDGYFEKPGIQDILCTYYADYEAEYAAMIAGETDYISGLEEEAANNIVSQNPNIEMTAPVTTYHRLWMVNTSGVAAYGRRKPIPACRTPVSATP